MSSVVTTSVAMCTFNGERFLAEQLESIVQQTRLPSELIVRDDRSTDASTSIVRRFAARSPFPVHLEINPSRLGSTRNFSSAIAACSGDLILLADQDDVWQPTKIEKMHAAFEENPELLLLFSDARVIDADGTPTRRTRWQHIPFTSSQQQLVHEGRAFELLVVRNVATGSAMAFRSNGRKLFLPIPDTHSTVHDRWIALLLSAAGRIDCTEDLLIDYRRHEEQQLGPERTGGLARVRAIRETGPALFREWAGQLRLAEERLLERRVAVCSESARQLRERITHLECRAEMPASLAPRLSSVTRELATGRYHRYSNGLLSAAKDLTRAYPR